MLINQPLHIQQLSMLLNNQHQVHIQLEDILKEETMFQVEVGFILQLTKQQMLIEPIDFFIGLISSPIFPYFY